jgi:hypothetical protein
MLCFGLTSLLLLYAHQGHHDFLHHLYLAAVVVTPMLMNSNLNINKCNHGHFKISHHDYQGYSIHVPWITISLFCLHESSPMDTLMTMYHGS